MAESPQSAFMSSSSFFSVNGWPPLLSLCLPGFLKSKVVKTTGIGLVVLCSSFIWRVDEEHSSLQTTGPPFETIYTPKLSGILVI